ncbi:hypothetical protein [Nocardia sp. NRRL S-836]|uniref:hypothetical protein n=1 Tax=Nocardia sp. NRRL S-836 TaxID=1519492 RepID=UPI0012F9A1FA|nr:hypothetical protein [Nocardia sp. NRRL S-836]
MRDQFTIWADPLVTTPGFVRMVEQNGSSTTMETRRKQTAPLIPTAQRAIPFSAALPAGMVFTVNAMI